MIVLFDTNVVLDVLLAREPFARPALELFSAVARGELKGVIGATTVTTIHYLARRTLGEQAARARISDLLDLFEVANVGEGALRHALSSSLSDFEDAVLHASGVLAGVTAVVTRDVQGFAGGSLAVFEPTQLLAVLSSRGT